MKAKIAVATVSGKAYYLIVDELKRRNIPFLSLTPYGAIPSDVRVVLTTEGEKGLIIHERKLAYQEGAELETLVNEALRIAQGKEHFGKIVIGVDPGKTFGLAVLVDGRVIETKNCYSVAETLSKIESILQNVEDDPTISILVRIGDGVPECKDKLLCSLDKVLPRSVILESVGEAGTNHCSNDTKHRRGLRDIVSAIKIAGRKGRTFQRRIPNGSKD
jgi:hypothetical protein